MDYKDWKDIPLQHPHKEFSIKEKILHGTWFDKIFWIIAIPIMCFLAIFSIIFYNGDDDKALHMLLYDIVLYFIAIILIPFIFFMIIPTDASKEKIIWGFLHTIFIGPRISCRSLHVFSIRYIFTERYADKFLPKFECTPLGDLTGWVVIATFLLWFTSLGYFYKYGYPTILIKIFGESM